MNTLIQFAEFVTGWAGMIGYAVGYILGVVFLVGCAGLCLMTIPFAWNTLRANQKARMKARQAVPETVPEFPWMPTIESGAVADRLYGRDLHEGRERA